MINNESLVLKERPTLRDFQDYVDQLVKVRGWQDEQVPEIFMLFLEECGELAKAVRKTLAMATDANSAQHHVDLEAADVFIYLLDLCNCLGVDLEQAFRDKEKINKKRVWS